MAAQQGTLPSARRMSACMWPLRLSLTFPICHPLCSFSARQAPDCDGTSAAGGQPRSRCFSEMLLCAGSAEQEAVNISQAGLHLHVPCCACAPALCAWRLSGGGGYIRRLRAAGLAHLLHLLPPPMPQAAQALVRLNSPLPPPPVTYPSCRTNGSRSSNSSGSTCLKVLFLTRSNKPAVRQASRAAARVGSRGWQHACMRAGGAACQQAAPAVNGIPPGTHTHLCTLPTTALCRS